MPSRELIMQFLLPIGSRLYVLSRVGSNMKPNNSYRSVNLGTEGTLY